MEVVTGSITDAAAVARAVAGVDRIYHLAGFVSRKPDDGARMYEVHVEGTRLLCQAARAAKVKRMVLASTSGTVAVSDRADEKPDESSPPPLALIGKLGVLRQQVLPGRDRAPRAAATPSSW